MPPRQSHQKKPSKSPLTHFLCLPLLTPTSTPRLRESTAHLKSVIEALEPASEEADVKSEATAKPQRKAQPLVPPAAFRPLGTLHLTLGVMSLREPERLQGALRMLEELDLAAMLGEVSEGMAASQETGLSGISASEGEGEQAITSSAPIEARSESGDFSKAEEDKNASNTEGAKPNESSPPSTLSRTITPPPPRPPPTSKPLAQPPSIPPSSSPTPHLHPHPNPPPLLIHLQGLSSFPPTTPQKATVLHTPPHDPTGRLLPFCQRLLSAFQSGGYVDSDCGPEPGRGTETTTRPRPLTLHATLVNTVYAKKTPEPRGRGEAGGGRSSSSRRRERGKITFDARSILRIFNERNGFLHADPTSTSSISTSKIPNPTGPTPSSKHSSASDTIPSSSVDGSNPTANAYAYIFAPSIPLTRVQICEMGAKPTNTTTTTTVLKEGEAEAEAEGMEADETAGLGARYVVVREKSILPGGSCTSTTLYRE